jgi:hypothetical protein
VASTAEQHQLTEVLLSQIQESGFPSPAQLDRVEQLISRREELETYIAVLAQKVEGTSYAAAPMLDRIQRLIRVLQRFDEEEQSER